MATQEFPAYITETENVEFDRQSDLQPTIREQILASRAGRFLMNGLVAVGLVTTASACEGQAYSDDQIYPIAADAGKVFTVTHTGGEGVWLHDDPGLGDSNDLIKIMPEGTKFTADCYVIDTPVGPRNNPVWLHGRDSEGDVGYFTDVYSSSRWGSDNTLLQQGLPLCGQNSAPVPAKPSNDGDDAPLGCAPYLVIGARGSGEAYEKDGNNPQTEGFGDPLRSEASLLEKYYGDANVTTYGLPYPAAAAITLISTPDNKYETGVSQGKSMLGKIIAQQTEGCADQEIILLGYSQGAEVVGDTLNTLSDDQLDNISAVGLFGDPKFNPRQSVNSGDFNRKRSGVNGERGDFSAAIAGRVISYCAENDPICNFTYPDFVALARKTSAHYHYTDNGGIGAVDRFIHKVNPR